MNRQIHPGNGDAQVRQGVALYLDRLVKHGPLSRHQRRWRILQRLACEQGQEKD